MGRFNFEAFDAEVAEKKLQQQRPRIKTFVPLNMSLGGRPRSSGRAVVGFTKSGCRFSSLAIQQFLPFGRHVEFMLQGNLLAMRFLSEPSNSSYMLCLGKDQTGKVNRATASFTALRRRLQEETDYVNFDVYNYVFLFRCDEKNIFYIELDRPFKKTKREKKQTK